MSVVLQALAAAGCAGALLTAVQATRALRDAARRRRSTGEAGARRRREFQSVVDETCRSTRQAALARPQEGPAPAWQGWRQFVVAGKAVEEASDIVTFHLVPQDGRPLPPFLPGQYVTVQLRIAGAERPVVRCYSLSCAPRPDRYEVSVKRVGPPPNRPDLGPGRASGHLHDQVRAGDVLDLQAPRGTFGLDPAAAGSRVVLIGGGVGLTPLLSVAQSLAKLAQAAPGREVWLFHGVRNGAQRLRRAELQHLAAIPGFRVAVCLSQPGPGEAAGPPGDPVTVLEGRLGLPLLSQLLERPDGDFLLCGPGGMMEDLAHGLAEWGVPPEHLHLEAFGPSALPRPAAPAASAAAEGPPLAVRFSRSERTCAWDPSTPSILGLAEAAGMTWDAGCRAGNCGSCAVQVLSGTFQHSRPPGATVPRGACLACIAVPSSDLVLDA